MSRDEFSYRIKDTLARRAGFLCSNPDCRKATVGSNENESKATSIGIAAHISAASEGGPRFNDSLTPTERSSIYNGIWLCGNCATLIDRDPVKYDVDKLRQWRQSAEIESAARLLGKKLVSDKDVPYLEADLLFQTGSRLPRGYSKRNPLKTDEKGNYYYDVSEKPIIHWTFVWRYNFVIHNQSNFPAFNIKLESIGDVHFIFLQEIPKINSLAPLESITLQARYEVNFEGTGVDADVILKPWIPNNLAGMQIKLTYFDEHREKHITLITFQSNEIFNNRITDQEL